MTFTASFKRKLEALRNANPGAHNLLQNLINAETARDINEALNAYDDAQN